MQRNDLFRDIKLCASSTSGHLPNAKLPYFYVSPTKFIYVIIDFINFSLFIHPFDFYSSRGFIMKQKLCLRNV